MGVDELDTLYFHGSVREVAKAVAAFTTAYDLTKRELYAKVLEDFKNGEVADIDRDLYEAYSKNLRKAVADVLQSGGYGDRYFDLQMQFEANVSRFAAYKAWHATRELKELEPDELDTIGRAKLNKYNRWQATEYNTAMARARTARQFADFTSDPAANMLYPNLKWLPSRSANPREEHRVFWNRVWAKDDPFWNENSPGSLWNCKCDWRETDEPVTDGNPGGHISHRGLEGNPAKTGEVFTDECPYVRNAGSETPHKVIKCVRDSFRKQHSADEIWFDTEIGKILFDEVTVKEITKGAKTDRSYFIKHEIALHFDGYVKLLEETEPQEIDLTHNNHSNIFYRRKSQFTKMRVFKLNVYDFRYEVKIGEFMDGNLNLYTITEPD